MVRISHLSGERPVQELPFFPFFFFLALSDYFSLWYFKVVLIIILCAMLWRCAWHLCQPWGPCENPSSVEECTRRQSGTLEGWRSICYSESESRYRRVHAKKYVRCHEGICQYQVYVRACTPKRSMSQERTCHGGQCQDTGATKAHATQPIQGPVHHKGLWHARIKAWVPLKDSAWGHCLS